MHGVASQFGQRRERRFALAEAARLFAAGIRDDARCALSPSRPGRNSSDARSGSMSRRRSSLYVSLSSTSIGTCENAGSP